MDAKKLKILVIDDDRGVRETLEAVITSALPGVRVFAALDGPTGLALARAEDPDVILLDIIMPGMDGFSVCRTLKADESLQTIPVIFLTARRSDHETRLEALDAGAEGFISKPFDNIELTAQIRAMAKIKAANRLQRLEKAELAQLVAERTRDLVEELTARKEAEEALARSNQILRVVSACNQALTHADDEAALMAQVCRVVVEIGGYRMAWVGVAEPDEAQTVRPVAVAGHDDGYVESVKISWGDTALGQGPTGRAIRTNQSVVNAEFATSAQVAPWREAARQRGYASSISLPLHIDGVPLGALSIYAGQPRAFDDQAVGLLEELASDLSYGIQALRNGVARKRAEEALQASEDKFRSVFEQSINGICLATPSGQLTMNKAACEMLGYSQEEFEHLTWQEITHPDDVESTRLAIDSVMRGEVEHTRLTKRYLHKDGSTLWADVGAVLRRDADGHPLYMISSIHDITEQKRVEEALQASEDLYHAIFEQAGDGIFLLDLTGTLVSVNEQFARMHGFTAEEILQKGLAVLDVEGMAPAPERIRRVVAGETLAFEVEHLHKDGHIFPLAVTAGLIKSGNKQLILAIHHDLTERKLAVESLQRGAALLQAQIECTNDGILIVDNEGVKILQNQRCIDLWKIPQQIVDNHDDAQQLEYVKNRAVDPEQFVEKVLYLYAHPEETILDEVAFTDGMTLERYSAPIVGADGTHFGRIWSFHDITERKQSEAERERLQTELQQSQKLESVGRLAGGIAHDFNNMLAAILGNAELALEKLHPEDPLYADLKEIRGAAQRSADLTRQLLAFARKQTAAPRVLDLHEAVAETLQMLRRLIGEDIVLTLRPAAARGPIYIDPTQVHQLLTNLCVNARDAIADAGTITIATKPVAVDDAFCAVHPEAHPGAFVLLAVRDSGCGMEPETLAKIFDPFFTTKGIGEGTGMGLSTVYGIVKQNGGFITVESTLGQGTTFNIYLPAYRGKAKVVEQAPPPLPVVHGGETILLVEDEPTILRLGRRMLEMHGYTVLTADTPGEAIRLAEAHAGDIQLLITDVVMPEMNGRDLAKRLLSLYPDIKRLFMSGYTANVIAHQGVLEEGVHFLQKPFSQQELVAKVREVIDQ